jgi:hypothetical protein
MEGNGDSRVNVVTYDRGPGYIIITPERIDNLPDQAPIFVSQTLEAWQKQNPSYRVRAVCPIVNGGKTIALHVWFDVVDVPQGPAVSGIPRPAP